MNVATWNVNGIRAREAQLLEWLAGARPDVLCLQEIKASREQVPATVAELPEYWNYWHGAAGGYSGVSLHLRRDTFGDPPAFAHPAFDMETRIVEAQVGDTTYASVYVPNGGKDFDAKMAFLRAMQGYTAEIERSGRRLVLCGDLNVALTDRDIHPSQNKPGLIGIRPEERELLAAIIGNGLVDVGRTLDPDNDRLFTWWPAWKVARQRNLGWRIDYILASGAIARHATACTVATDVPGSDHAPVMATFDVDAG